MVLEEQDPMATVLGMVREVVMEMAEAEVEATEVVVATEVGGDKVEEAVLVVLEV